MKETGVSTRILAVTVLGLALSASGVRVPAQTPSAPEKTAEAPRAATLQARLQAVLDAWHASAAGSFPGATAGVTLADGTVLGLAVGVSDRETRRPMTPADRMLAGSVGKTYVSAVALQLVHERKLSLDDRIEKHLGTRPWFARLPNARDITVRMLMNHTSGLVRYEFRDEFTRDLTRQPDKVRKPEELIAYILGTTPPFAAGQGWEYSDTNYIVLGLIIEQVTGSSYYEQAQKRLLTPLGLRGTGPSDRRVIPGLVQGYAGATNPFGGVDGMIVDGRFAINPQFEWCGGGMATTAPDLAAWAKRLYEGRAFDAALMDELLRGVPAKLGPEAKYGLGVIVKPSKFGTTYGHSGFMPGYVTEMAYFPEHRIAAAVQVNTSVARATGRPLARVLADLVDVVVSPPADTMPDDLRAALASIDAKAVRAHVEFLADDLLEGRAAATRGYDLAARYVATQLALAGLQPAGDDGTFFQKVPLIESTLETATLALKGANGTSQPLVFAEDFLAGGSLARTETSLEAPVVFAGFGVTAPELKHDDYAGLDVRGKFVAVLTNAPPRFPSEQRAHYSSTLLKAENAAKRGARGMLVLRTPDEEKRSPWARLVSSLGKGSMTWIKPDGSPAGVAKEIVGGGVLSVAGARKLFAGLPGRLDAIYTEAEKGEPRGMDLGVTASFTSRSKHATLASANVVGLIEGSDPTLKDTTVVCTAHLDHVGIGRAVKGDTIYNGAYDNALGSAILIEAARALAKLPTRPARSIAFVFVTAEEKGLVGSDYFATLPPAAARRLVANVNVDMPLLLFPIDKVVAFGSEHSTLQAVTARAASLSGLTLIPDPIPQENLFIRSDQYSFVRQGIPSVLLVPSLTSSDPAIDGMKMFGEFLSTHYHMPSDDLSLPVNAGAVERFARANVTMAYLIASDRAEPRWNPGDFFGTTFSRAR